MKKVLLTPLFLLALSCFSQNLVERLNSDSVKLVIEYNVYNGYVNDNNYTRQMPAKVFIGKNMYLTDILVVSGKEDSANVASQLSSQKIDETQKSMILQKHREGIHSITVSVYGSPTYFFYVDRNDKRFFVEDTALFTWQLSSETKKIGELNCQKAIGKYGRDSVVAWFTEQIPINAGPNKVNGLPGLILEYYNPSNKTFYKLSKITNAPQQEKSFKDFSGTSVIKKDQYNEMAIEDHKNAEKVKKIIESGKMDKSQF